MTLSNKNITLKDIAVELGVSISTVSKALKDSKEISEKTKKRIQAFAQLHNYHPNVLALNLKNQTTQSIAVILPQIVNNFFSKVMEGIELEASRRNYKVIFTVSLDSYERETENMEMLENGGVDGFILSLAKKTLKDKNYRHLFNVIEKGFPLVLFDRTIDEISCDKVIIDDKNGGFTATEKLIKTGCENIVFITTDKFISVANLRFQGYNEALEKHNIPFRKELIIQIKDQFNTEEIEQFIFQELKKIFHDQPKVDGIIGVNEIYTVIAVNYLKKLNKKIPAEVSVISFSDGVLPRYSYPPLTAVSQNGKKMGEQAARLLIDRLENKIPKKNCKTIVIDTELIERGSTK